MILEIKSVESLGNAHLKQLLTYLRLTQQPVGLLLNFAGATMKEGIRRVVNEYRQRDGHLYVSLRYYQTEPVRRFREQGLRVVVMKSREWEFHQPERDTAWPYIDFVEDLGTVLGTKLRGRPLS